MSVRIMLQRIVNLTAHPLFPDVRGLPAWSEVIHDARNFLAIPEPPPLPVATPITPVHKMVFVGALRRAKDQHERPGVKRDRCALDIICGAAIAFNAAGDTTGARSMENAALLVSVRGATILEELTK